MARTRRLLRDALVALIHERGWDAVSVQDVCARADVGRSTFYLHFADKEDLLVSGFDELKSAMRAASDASGGGPLAFARPLLAHAEENQRLFRALVGKRTGNVILQRFRRILLELTEEDLRRFYVEDAGALEGAAHYVAGAFLELLAWSTDARGGPAHDVVADTFARLTASVLTQLSPRARRRR